MALEGQLSDFNLAEIFQLIAGQQKTGFLVLEAQNEMVFVFDKGILISTRDRRDESDDPLERFLRTYGFFEEKLWSHIEFVRQNSSLDLTEILQSEQIMTAEELEKVLSAVALELTYRCMKLKRGRYHFTATRETPKGVRGRIKMNVQAVLMEAARRLDEEHRLTEVFPSPAVTFQAGSVDPKGSGLDESDRRLYNMALSGEPLGQILANARVDSFTAREHLVAMCENGYLKILLPEGSEPTLTEETAVEAPRTSTGPRSVTLTIIALILVVGVGALRWLPLLAQEADRWGIATAVVTAGAMETDPGTGTRPHGRSLRFNQIRSDLVQALELFGYRHGKYPMDLSLLVKQGLLSAATYRTVFYLGWTYQLNENGRGYSLAT